MSRDVGVVSLVVPYNCAGHDTVDKTVQHDVGEPDGWVSGPLRSRQPAVVLSVRYTSVRSWR